jgi:alcohol dehydrogenase (cytochrome c)
VTAANDAFALDARTGQVVWHHSRPISEGLIDDASGHLNRGVAVWRDRVYMETDNAHLLCLDARSGNQIWDVAYADWNKNYGATGAPLVVKDKVLVGTSGGDDGVRGFIAAYDAMTGKLAWRFWTIPGPGEFGSKSWPGQAYLRGGGTTWMPGTYDPALNLIYWGTSNPAPDFNDDVRPGDDLYTDSVLALDPDTGTLKWYFQFTPHDPYDYDSVQVPVLANANWNGSPRKLMLWGNRNGFFYVLDRGTGKFLNGKPFVKVNWASGLDANGRPIATPQPAGVPTYPGIQGGTNWYAPSYSPSTGLFYLSTWEDYGTIFSGVQADYKEGTRFTGGANTSPVPGAENPTGARNGPVNTYTEAMAHGGVVAIDPATGDKKWHFEMHDVNTSGILTTATDLLFVGGREGYFQALNARTGTLLWKQNLGGEIIAGPISFQVDGKQYITIASGNSLFAFALRE